MSVLESQFPVNYPQQREFINQLLQEIKTIEALKRPVFLRSRTRPTKADWETAWSNQTGLGPPILPGAKLLWQSKVTGKVRGFTVALDSDLGTTSSGTVIDYLSPATHSNKFRHIAVGQIMKDGGINHVMQFFDPTTPPVGSDVNHMQLFPYELARHGLVAYLIMGQVNTDSTANGVDCDLSLNFNGRITDPYSFIKDPDAFTYEYHKYQIRGTTRLDVPSGFSETILTDGDRFGISLTKIQTDGNSSTTTFSIWVLFPTLRTETLTEQKASFTVIFQTISQRDDVIDTTDTHITYGSFRVQSSLPPRYGVSLQVVEDDPTLNVLPITGYADLYGMFTESIEELRNAE